MSQERDEEVTQVRRLQSEADARERDMHTMSEREHRHETLVNRLRQEAAVRDDELRSLRERFDAAEHELEDLRAIRDALTPPELPDRPGMEVAAAFLPAVAEQVSGDFYLVAEGPQDSTVLVVGDVVGQGAGGAPRSVRPDSVRRNRTVLR
jgi:sigma-B regulation protein RsbU (phosphoserine phosphatase)